MGEYFQAAVSKSAKKTNKNKQLKKQMKKWSSVGSQKTNTCFLYLIRVETLLLEAR